MSSRFWFGDLGGTWNFADFDHGLSKSLTHLIDSHDLARGLTNEVAFLPDVHDLARGLTNEVALLPDVHDLARGLTNEVALLPDVRDLARGVTNEVAFLPDVHDVARGLTNEVALLPDVRDLARGLTTEPAFPSDIHDLTRGLTKDFTAIASRLDEYRSWVKAFAATREFVEFSQGISSAAAYLVDVANPYREQLKNIGSTAEWADFSRGLLKGMASINEYVAPFREMRFTVAGELVNSHRHAIRTPNIDVDWLLKATPSSSEVARGVDSIFDAILALDTTSSEPQRENREAAPVGHTEKRGRHDSKPRLWVPRSALSQRPTNGESKSTLKDVAPLSPVTIFCDYAHADREFLDELMKHLVALKSSGIAQTWHHGHVLAGEDRERLIMEHLEVAKIILLLISADYLDTLYEQNKASQIEAQIGRAIVVPVLVRSVDIEGTFIERLSPLPSTGSPITDWTNSDTAWTHVARGVRTLIEGSRSASKSLISKVTRR